MIFFQFAPSGSNPIQIVTGFYRIFATFSISIIVLFFIQLKINSDKNILALLGKASYSIYILHPIIFSVIMRLLKVNELHIDKTLGIILSVIITLICSILSHKYFESYFIAQSSSTIKN